MLVEGVIMVTVVMMIKERGDGEDAGDKADSQYKLWSRVTDSLKHHPGPGDEASACKVSGAGSRSKPPGSDFWLPRCFAVHQP